MKYVVVYMNDSEEYESTIVDAESLEEAHDAAFDLSDDYPVVTLALPDLPGPPMSFDDWYLQPSIRGVWESRGDYYRLYRPTNPADPEQTPPKDLTDYDLVFAPGGLRFKDICLLKKKGNH